MRAALLREELHHLHVDDVVLDAPLDHEVLVRVVASGLCHSDLHFIDGSLPAQYPLLLGHEAAGVVEAVGDDVRSVAVGDHVISCLSVHCGTCDRCLSGASYLCRHRDQLGKRAPGESPRVTRAGDDPVFQSTIAAFAEAMLVHEHALVRIDPAMPLDRAAIIGCAVTTGVGAVFHSAGVTPGSTVAVIGCGGVGMSAVQGAHLAGARTIIAVDRVAQKLDAAAAFGATHAIDATAGDAAEEVLELTHGGVDYSFEAIGLRSTIEQAYAMIRPGGVCTVMGVAAPGVDITLPAQSLLQVKRLQGCYMGNSNFKVDMPKLCDLYLGGRLKLDEMVTGSLTLDEINDGFAAMEEGTALRSVVRF